MFRVLVLSALALVTALPSLGSDLPRASARHEQATSCGGSSGPDASPTAIAEEMATPRSGATAASTDGPVLQTVGDIPLPGDASRFDYQSLDQTTGRLYLAHMGAGQLEVFDVNSREVVGTVKGLPTVTGVLAVPEVGFVYAAVAGDHQVAVIDDRTLEVVARVGDIGFPDGLAYAPSVRQVFVSDESGGGELVIDTRTNEVVTTVDLGGDAGNTHFDPTSGCIVVAVQTLGQLALIDPATHKVVGRVTLDANCEGPHGFLIDPPAKLAFVTCEGNAMLLVVDLATTQVIATFPVGEGPDVLAFDPGWSRLYVASESGVVSVFDERAGVLRLVGEITMPDAHSVEVDPRTHLLYLPLANVGGEPVLRIMSSPSPQG